MFTKKEKIFLFIVWTFLIAGMVLIWDDIRNDEIIQNLQKK